MKMSNPDLAKLAELYVAGTFAGAGWQVFLPHQDQGFDFVIYKASIGQTSLLPVQVRGCYRQTSKKTDMTTYGKPELKFSQLHPQLIVALPFFAPDALTPELVAYGWLSDLKINSNTNVHRWEPACLKDGVCTPRRDSVGYFGKEGLARLEMTLLNPTAQ